MYRNRHHLPLQAVQQLFNGYLERYESIASQAESVHALQMESALSLAGSATFKIVHPLLIESWRSPRVKNREHPIKLVGLDIETVAHCTCKINPSGCQAGQAKLIGCFYPDSTTYYPMLNPDLKSFFKLVRGVVDNTKANGFAVWGRLDIQCIIRLFNPTENERKRISRGLNANVKQGKIIGTPPVLRTIQGIPFYIAHHISGRSLKLAYIENGREWVVWIYNISQFYEMPDEKSPNQQTFSKIAAVAKGLGLEWLEFAKNTHIVEWDKFNKSQSYKLDVLNSNKQDARTVSILATELQDVFHDVFNCYPSLLVSTGSLTDAAVSKMLAKNPQDYYANSWKWLCDNVWKKQHHAVKARADALLSEAFSAGYVDQFAIGYFPELHTADISSAYPHKIQQLSDLRYAVLLDGKENLDDDLARARQLGYEIDSAIIRGVVTIPDSLKYHPITVKTYDRENIRPTGTFHAAYYLEEREFCRKYGAIFSNEEYIIIGLRKQVAAPIAQVSETLSAMRAAVLAEIKTIPKGSDKSQVLSSRQSIIKKVNNSIYGKTVMTTEVVKDIDGQPVITGYIAGDRFNPYYGGRITAGTRIQVAEACMNISNAGGKPVMAMTDSIWWVGKPDDIPSDMVRKQKTNGYFEIPSSVNDAFILKTGQYEYRKGERWEYKLRGLPVEMSEVTGRQSLFRRMIQEKSDNGGKYIHPADFIIKLHTRRLVSIGSQELHHLGMISDTETNMRPFSLSGKQSERWVMQWPDTIDSAIFFETPKIDNSQTNGTDSYPLTFLSKVYEGHAEAWSEKRMQEINLIQQKVSKKQDDIKLLFIWIAGQETSLPTPSGRAYRLSWEFLQKYYGKTREQLPRFQKIVKGLETNVGKVA